MVLDTIPAVGEDMEDGVARALGVAMEDGAATMADGKAAGLRSGKAAAAIGKSVGGGLKADRDGLDMARAASLAMPHGSQL